MSGRGAALTGSIGTVGPTLGLQLPGPVAEAWRTQLSTALAGPSQDGCAERLDDELARADEGGHERKPSTWWTHYLVFALPVAAALALVGIALSRIDLATDLVILSFVVLGLIAGHVVLRSRNRRIMAEHETARVREELDLRQRVAECEERRHRLAAYSQLAAQIAHEVRNPLSSIVLNTELLEEEMGECCAANSGEIHALVDAIKCEAERLHALTDEYLAFARLPAPERSLVSLNRLVTDVLGFMREETSRCGVEVALDLDPGQPDALADPKQLRQVIVNLVRNAVEAMPCGGRLDVSTRHRGIHVSLDVSDSGPGIPDDQRRLVFEPFFSTKAQGTGLGLSVALRIVQEHGGTIDVLPGAGACFRVTLPAVLAVEPGSSRGDAEPLACGVV
jgi:signal transduction histidine kinase